MLPARKTTETILIILPYCPINGSADAKLPTIIPVIPNVKNALKS